MKTTEEKAKAYDKVRKKIAIRFGSNVADEFFAEFEGSKDEEIRKALLEMVHDTTGDELWVDYNIHKEEALAWLEKQGQERKITHEEICKSYGIPDIGEFSDGYHTFNGLYKQRMILFAVLVKTYKDRAWKSWKHEDGLDCFGGGWFIVGIDTPAGTYTYHYEAKDWDRFDCQILEKAKHWDGHDEYDVERLFSLVSNTNKDEVIRCLINGMKFYYEDNEEATWGTEKFSMKVKDILSWLEKQGEQKDYTFKSIPRLLEIIEPSNRAKAYCQKLINTLVNEGYNNDAKIVEEVLNGWNGENIPMAVMDEQNPTDKVEPKFKVGDKIYLKPEYRMPDDDTPIANTVKEIRRIDDKHYRFDGSYIFIEDQDKYELVEQNPAWSEEDERLCQCLIEDQEEFLNRVSNDKYGHSEIISDLKEMYHERIDWLKSLRPQNHWKPSDEQISLLQAIINEPNNAASESCQIVLKDILEQLKKLKEG